VNDEQVAEKIQQVIKTDDPTILASILEDKMDDNEDYTVKEMIEDGDDITTLLEQSVNQNKPKLFKFMKDNFDITERCYKEMNLVQYEKCTAIIIRKPSYPREIDIAVVYDVNDEGELVFDQSKLISEDKSEIFHDALESHDIDFDEGITTVYMENSEYEHFMADDPDVRRFAKRECFEKELYGDEPEEE